MHVAMRRNRPAKWAGARAMVGVALFCLAQQVGPTNSAINFGSIVARYLELNVSATSVYNEISDREMSAAQTTPTEVPAQSPILFIPGDGGSQLEAKLNKPTHVHYLCDYVADWFDIWLNIHLLAPGVFDCLCDNMRLVYNKTSRTTLNSPGVEIRPTNFGALDSVDYLDVAHLPGTTYFNGISSALEKNNGYVRDVNMIGAAYDFRKAPNELDEFFANLTTLIENFYVNNNYKPVTLICHSMGCLNSLYLLNNKTENWKEVFIRRLITLAAPWSGSFKAISATLYGDNLGIPLLNRSKLQALQSTFPSLMYLFPREPEFDRARVLVETPMKNYTLANLEDLFKDAQMPDQREMWHDTRAIAQNLKAPNVELWCLYGSGVDTPNQIVYWDSIDTNKYKELQGDGDGTVNLESSRACELFAAQQQKPVFTRMFDGVDHISILRGAQAADFISTFIMAEDSLSSPASASEHSANRPGENT